MNYFGHAVLFFFSGFTGYLFNAERGSALGIFLLIGLPIVGIYFLGWWALLTFVVGAVFGGRVFWGSVQSGQNNREERMENSLLILAVLQVVNLLIYGGWGESSLLNLVGITPRSFETQWRVVF